MIVSDGYTLTYDKKNNRIVITLPQTIHTINNTVSMITNRKIDLTEGEETLILTTVKAVMEMRENNV